MNTLVYFPEPLPPLCSIAPVTAASCQDFSQCLTQEQYLQQHISYEGPSYCFPEFKTSFSYSLCYLQKLTTPILNLCQNTLLH